MFTEKDKRMAKNYAAERNPTSFETNGIFVRERITKFVLQEVERAFLAGLSIYKPKWHKVSDKLPEMDVFVYLWNKIDDFPMIARRHIPYEQKDWVWDCKWGSGFTISQSVGEDYLWKEIVLPKK